MTHVHAGAAKNIKSVVENSMGIKPKCDKCKKELKVFGGILLSPPKKEVVKKYHLCKSCYTEIVKSHNIGK